MVSDLVLELLSSFIGAIPDRPGWLRRLVILLYVLVIGGCAAGLVVVIVSSLS